MLLGFTQRAAAGAELSGSGSALGCPRLRRPVLGKKPAEFT
jgi:hypothetical protein